MKSNDLQNDTSAESPITRAFHSYNRLVQRTLDRLTPYLIPRWIMIVVMLFKFMYNVIIFQGFYIIAYVLGIFLLNQFILFLSPSVLNDDYDNDDSPGLPTHRSDSDEFRPFMRRLPEFKFWYTTFKACLISIVCTYFDIFDIPVFWPILVMYFITLFVVTMKRQIMHMIKHRYVPFSYGKIRYQGNNKADSGGSKSKSSKN